MKLRLLLLTTVVIAAAAACVNDSTPTLDSSLESAVQHGKPFNLHLANSVVVFANGQSYRLDFTKVVGDSRCAVGEDCLRPNAVILEVSLANLSTSDEATVHTLFFDSGLSEGIVGPFTVQILGIAPTIEKMSSSDDYVITLTANITPVGNSLDVKMTSTSTNVNVGDLVTYTASAVDAGSVQYSLMLESIVVGVLRQDGTLVRGSQTPVIELIEWAAGPSEASWTIRPLYAGSFRIQVAVTGEVLVGDKGEFSFVQGAEELPLHIE